MNKRHLNIQVYLIVLDEQPSYSDARDAMVRMSDGATSVPQVFINGNYEPGGYNGLVRLNDLGELDPLLSLPPPKGDEDKWSQFIKRQLSLLDIGSLDF
jgi:glutaredoxin